jgi:hypothetical protein
LALAAGAALAGGWGAPCERACPSVGPVEGAAEHPASAIGRRRRSRFEEDIGMERDYHASTPLSKASGRRRRLDSEES